MTTRTIQVQHFYNKAKKIGLNRGDFSARSPKDVNGEYKPMEIVIYARLTEKQCRQLAEDYKVIVYQMNGETRWHNPSIQPSGRGIELWDLDNTDQYGLATVTKL